MKVSTIWVSGQGQGHEVNTSGAVGKVYSQEMHLLDIEAVPSTTCTRFERYYLYSNFLKSHGKSHLVKDVVHGKVLAQGIHVPDIKTLPLTV